MTKAAFAPHQVKSVQPLQDSILVHDMIFDERISSGGIVLLSDNGKSTGIRPRWGQVYAVGPKQTDVKVGEWLLIAHGRWTRGMDIEDETGKKTIRKVDPKEILLRSNSRPVDVTFSSAIHVEAKPAHMQHN
jgi:co-chaperonin GroES (HSP10)